MGNKKDPKDDLVTAEEIENDLLELFGIENWEDLTLQEEGPDFDCAGGKEAFFFTQKQLLPIFGFLIILECLLVIGHQRFR